MSGTDNLNVVRGGTAAESAEPTSNRFTREVPVEQRVGRSGLPRGRARLYRYDRFEGASRASYDFEVDKADRLPIARAQQLMHTLHMSHGVHQEMEGYLYSYDHALFVCYALNGSSQLNPSERVKFYVQGGANEFDYQTVHNVLDVEFRRFFRTYADDVVSACKYLYEHCDFENENQLYARSMMISLADARGIRRYPWLVADCCDAATSLSQPELAAVYASKRAVIASTPNSVDKRNLAQPIKSSDNFDSSTGESVPVANDVSAAGNRGTYYS